MIFLWWVSLYITYRSHLLNFSVSPLFSATPPLLSFSLHILFFTPFIWHPPLRLYFLYLPFTSLDRVRRLQLSHVATPVALSTAAPRAMASTTTTWCTSSATKATRWRDPPELSVRPAASGASSHPHVEVKFRCRATAACINDWQWE